jgi:hypothetical protein
VNWSWRLPRRRGAGMTSDDRSEDVTPLAHDVPDVAPPDFP